MRRTIWSLAVAVLTVASLSGSQFGIPYGERASQGHSAIESARALVRAYMAARGTPGTSVAVGINDRIVWSEGFGLANVESGAPVTTLSRFRSGSTAKPMTMAAAAVLYERGKFDLDAPIQRYVPSFPDKGVVITPRLLAGHLAGIRHYPPEGEEFFNAKHYDNVVDALEIFRDDPLLFKPGTRYSYSSYGTNLLGAAVAAAAGQDFEAFVSQVVFEPLGMRSTIADDVDRIIPNRTGYYERTGAKPSYHIRKSSWGKGEKGMLLNGPYSDNSNKRPSGGWLTTPEDLVRFGSAHLKPGFLKADTLKMMLTSQRTLDGKETGYGMCWTIRLDKQGRRTLSHGGGGVGGTSDLLMYPDSRVVVAIQANLTDADFGELPEQIAQLFSK